MYRVDLDRYYTPATVAARVIGASEGPSASGCIDGACGDGSLLKAALALWPQTSCVGMDLDGGAIAKLRVRHPDWTLSRGDALSASTWRRSRAGRAAGSCDVAVANPPFSMGTTRGVRVSNLWFSGRCSVAMAHVMAVLSTSMPTVCGAILPESMLFADIDQAARLAINKRFSVTIVETLQSTTFKGARANALIVRFERRKEDTDAAAGKLAQDSPRTVRLVRGGLPVFEAVESRQGLEFVHSTNITVDSAGARVQGVRVRPIGRGRVRGTVLFLPRVGRPRIEDLRVVKLAEEVQMSDCVLALAFSSRREAAVWQKMIHEAGDNLLSLYRGTGARYITVARLSRWLADIESASGARYPVARGKS